MKKTVLITGATGFVGSHVLKALLKDGDYLIKAIARSQSADKILPHQNLSVVFSDNLFCEDDAWWEKQCKGVDIVLHLAWNVEPGKYLESDSNLECLTGSLRLAVGAAKSRVKKFIGIGTCFEYDLNQSTPHTAYDPLYPQTLYAKAKVALFSLCTSLFLKNEIDFAWCRLFYLYGEGEDERRLVPYIQNRLSKGAVAELTSGNQVRDFIDVQIAAKMICRVVGGSKVGPVNICSGYGITIRQLAEKIADTYGRRDLLNFGGRPDNITDPPMVVGVAENF